MEAGNQLQRLLTASRARALDPSPRKLLRVVLHELPQRMSLSGHPVTLHDHPRYIRASLYAAYPSRRACELSARS